MRGSVESERATIYNTSENYDKTNKYLYFNLNIWILFEICHFHGRDKADCLRLRGSSKKNEST